MSPIQEKEVVVEIPEAIITLRTDAIIEIQYRQGVVIDVELQMKMYDIFNDICKGRKRPFLFCAFDNVSVTPEGRENAIVMEDIFPGSATAVLANTLAYKLIANFYLKVNRPKTPFRVFNSKEDAVKWLLTFTEE